MMTNNKSVDRQTINDALTRGWKIVDRQGVTPALSAPDDHYAKNWCLKWEKTKYNGEEIIVPVGLENLLKPKEQCEL